jgi:hypothetical protein
LSRLRNSLFAILDLPKRYSRRERFMKVPNLVIGLALSTLLVGDVSAALDVTCDKPVLRAEGRRSGPGSASYKERMARRYSIRKWEQLASELHGRDFARWRIARERNIECEHYSDPPLGGRVSCVASGRPCAKR